MSFVLGYASTSQKLPIPRYASADDYCLLIQHRTIAN